MGWINEDLSDQVDGLEDTFTTSHAKTPGRLMVWLDGSLVDPATVTEPALGSFQLSAAPAGGSKLVAFYNSDEVVDGRALGFPEDPTD